MATDVAGNTTEQTSTLWTDHEAPGAPRSLQLNGGTGWRSANRSTSSGSARRPMPRRRSRARTDELCPAANAPHDTSGCVTVRRAASDRIQD